MSETTVTVTPFSGPRYAENSARCGDQSPCVLCGKLVVNPSAWAEVVDGGARFGPNDGTADANDAGYMGCFPVGRECRKSLAKAGVSLRVH